MKRKRLKKKEVQEEETGAKSTVTTPRYEKAYKVPNQQLKQENGHHQVLVEPITAGSGIIKGHTSVKGKVALQLIINLLILVIVLMLKIV